MNSLNLLIHPVQYFQQFKTKEKVSLLIPIIIIIVLGVLAGIIAGNAVSTLDVPTDQKSTIKWITIGAGVFSGIIGLGIALVVKAGIFHFVLKKMGGTGTFKTAVYVVGLAQFPKIFQSILNVIFQKPLDLTAASAFDWVAFFAGIFSVFNIWQLFITIIGLSVVYGVSYKKTAIPVIGLEVLSAGLSLGISLLTVNSVSGITTSSIK